VRAMLRIQTLAIVVGAVLLRAAAARANGAFPDSQSIMTPESLPHEIRLATNFGVISSDDDGQTWLWSCEQPESNNGSLYQIGPAPKNRMFVISSEGLAYSDSEACGWAVATGTITGTAVADAFPDPTNVNRVLAVVERATEAGISYSVVESSDGGTTFGPTRYTAAAGDNITGVEIARSAPSTIYVAMTSGSMFAPKLVRSTDGGTTWKVDDLSTKLPTKTTLIRLVAVDPTNPDRVFLRTHSAAGDTFSVAVAGASGYTIPTTLSFPDGILAAYARLANGNIFVAAVVGLDQVAYRSADAGATFQPLPTPPSVRAMSARGSTLYVVADNVADGYAVGTSTDEGQTWQPLMSYDQVAAIQACVKQACQTDCQMRAAAGQWADDFCAATAPAMHDAGPPDGNAGDDAGMHGDAAPIDSGGPDASTPPPQNSGCWCDAASANPRWALSLIAALVLVAGLRRRSRAGPGNRR